MNAPTSVKIARLLYLLVCQAAGLTLALSTRGEAWEIPVWIGIFGGLLVGGFFILVESLMKGFSLRGFSTATFGLLVGLFCAFLLTRVGFSEILGTALSRGFGVEDRQLSDTVALGISVTLYASLGFLGAVLALRSGRDDFAFILPYVRFRQDSSSGQPVVLDAAASMDGRVLGVLRSGFIHGRLVVPRFVLDELERLAESDSKARSQQSRRGLDMLDEMQQSGDIQITIEEVRDVAADETMNGRLMDTCELLGARLMTSDDQLSKVARLRGLETLNLNELTEALRPVLAVGERIRLALVRAGKEEHQAVGYLEDGTMIVVNHAVKSIGATRDVLVVSTLQTQAGQLVFAELCGE